MKKFEYETIVVDTKGFLGGKIDDESLKSKLNEMGRQGWELVEVTTTNQGYGETRHILCVFMKELI